MKALALIPIRLDPEVNPHLLALIGGQSALARTVSYASQIAGATGIAVDVSVATNDPAIRAALNDFPHVSTPHRHAAGLEEALVEALLANEKSTGSPYDLVFVLEPMNPFRPATLAAEATTMLLQAPGLDSVVAVEHLHGRLWSHDPALQSLADSVCANPWGTDAPFREAVGLMLVSRRRVFAQERRVGDNVGLIVVDRKWAFPDIHSRESLEIARHLEPLYRNPETGSLALTQDYS